MRLTFINGSIPWRWALPMLLGGFIAACMPKDRPSGGATLSAAARQQLQDSLRPGFEIMPGFEIELFAAEPLIGDPVAMEIDEQGRLFVVEMHGYPLDLGGTGVIRELMDTDQDGFPDSSRVFKAGLTLPTGILRWKNGFIVTDAPDVLYLEDTDGDGVADREEVLLTGFALSNPQHNMNSPVYGLDNWIYLANEYYISTAQFDELLGDEGAEIHYPARPQGPRLPANGDDKSVRFQPDAYALESLSSNTQYGHTFDPWGHYFQTSNASHLHHEVIAHPYLARKPGLMVADAMQYVPDYGRPVEVWAITPDPEHQLLTDVGTITSACGIHWYRGGLFPAPFDQVVFTAEPVHNLIHADLMHPAGATFSASRLLPDREFLASTDPEFRPVFHYTGPDGAMYVVDYYRKIIEHPEWMSESVNNSGALYAGTQKGRIYRIFPSDSSRIPWMGEWDLGEQNTASLVEALTHRNHWWRCQAQRLLVDRKDPQAVEAIHALWTRASAEGKVHLLWTLEGMGQLRPVDVGQALADPHPGVRENAVRLAEGHLEDWASVPTLLATLKGEGDPRVRFQLMCTLGAWEGEAYATWRLDLLREQMSDPWMQLAALSSPALEEDALLASVLTDPRAGVGEGWPEWVGALASSLALNGRVEQVNTWLGRALEDRGSEAVWWQAALLKGLSRGLRYRKPLRDSVEVEPGRMARLFSMPAPLREAWLDLLPQLAAGAEMAGSPLEAAAIATLGATPPRQDLQADALAVLAVANAPAHQARFEACVQPHLSGDLQQAAIQALGAIEGPAPGQFLLRQWPNLSPQLRQSAIPVMLSDKARSLLLLDAIRQGAVDQATLGWPRSVSLLNHDDPEIRQQAREILKNPESDRNAALEKYEGALAMQGQPARGFDVFKAQCASCHTYQGKHGLAIGPDLATLRNRMPRSLMMDILMPNRSIADGYGRWTLTLEDGSPLTGILSKETTHALTLTQIDGSQEVVARNAVSGMEPVAASLMPEGLEATMDARDMADLLAFIREGQPLP